jgi:hypothetical protein
MRILVNREGRGWTVITESGVLGVGLDEAAARELLYELQPDDVVGVNDLFENPPDPAAWRSLWAEAIAAEVSSDDQAGVNQELGDQIGELSASLAEALSELRAAKAKIARLSMLADERSFELELNERVRRTMMVEKRLSEAQVRAEISRWMRARDQ